MYLYRRSYQIDYFCGWRYIFSPAFRVRVHEKWNGNRFARLACVLGGFLGVVLTSALAMFFLAAAWRLLAE